MIFIARLYLSLAISLRRPSSRAAASATAVAAAASVSAIRIADVRG